MILVIEATVTATDQVMTGSVAVTVNEPPAQAEDPNLQMRQRAQVMQGGVSRA